MLSSKLAIILLIACAISLGQVENKSLYGIGQRIQGDQLLVKDVLQSRLADLDESQTVNFNYAIKEPITYINILTEKDVTAEVNFSYENELVRGSIVPTNITRHNLDPFEVQIMIYGFNDTILGVSNAFLLNRDQQFEGFLRPDEADDSPLEYMNSTVDGLEDLDYDENNEHNDNGLADDDDEDDDSGEDDYGFESTDKIIDVGRRQKGDYLIYDTFQTTAASIEPTNHSVVFYYIDSNYITYAKFIVFDRNIFASDYIPPIAEYTHFSPSTLKATITDFKTRNLFAQMFLYGYQPADLPVDYVPFLSNRPSDEDNGYGRGVITESPLYRAVFNAQTRNGDENDNDDGVAVAQSEELQVFTNGTGCSGDDEDCSNGTDGAIATIHTMSTSYLSILTSLGATLCFAAARWQI